MILKFFAGGKMAVVNPTLILPSPKQAINNVTYYK